MNPFIVSSLDEVKIFLLGRIVISLALDLLFLINARTFRVYKLRNKYQVGQKSDSNP